MKSTMHMIKMSLVGIAALVGAQFIVAASHSAEAKQCVWNKAALVLRVEWYQANQVYRDDVGMLYAKHSTRAVQTDVFPIAQGRCLNRKNPHVAILKFEGQHGVKKPQTKVSKRAAESAGIARTVVCNNDRISECKTVIPDFAVQKESLAAPSGRDNTGLKSIDVEAFGTTIPSTNRWLDVWGTIWNPQIGPGGWF